MSVITHGRQDSYQPESLSPQQKAAIGRIARRAGRMLFGAAIAVVAVSVVVGLKAVILMTRLPINW